ncbi:TonB-dependent siderophore receptor, partial [Acinetobacter puyangensis]|uniref:TonB-dependent siderophore receptor n=1 Tax=Acinetobacter puyangensis TaxID=1096779 RepID=UPI003A4E437A
MKTTHGQLLKPLVLAIQLSLAAGCSIYAVNGHAENQYLQSYNIGAGALSDALTQFSLQSGTTLTIEHNKLKGLKTAGLSGQYSIESGFNTLLENTPYTIQKNADHYILVEKPQGQQPQVRDMGQLKPIDVTVSGSARANNGVVQLPVITINAEKNGSAEDGYLVKNLKQVGPWGEKSLQDTPYSMTVMSEDLISNAIAGDMDQIYKMNPIIQNSTPMAVDGYPIAIFRGVENDIGIIDGLRLSSNSRGVAMEELERIEIINGLTGFMYGVSGGEGIGGTTNYVIKRPTYQRLKNLTIGNYGNQQWFGHLDLGNQIDEKGRFAYRLNLSHQNGETGKENQNVERTLISGALDWNVTDDFQLQLEAAHTYYKIDKLDSRFYAYKNDSFDSLGYWIEPLENDKTYTPDWTYNETKTDRVGLNATWNINDIFTFRSAYMYKKDEDKSAYTFPIYFEDSGWINNWTNKKAPSWNIAQGAYAYLDSKFNTGSIKHKLTFGASGDILDVKQYENGYLSGGNSSI